MTEDEVEEFQRIIAGGDFNQRFWDIKLRAARELRPESQLQQLQRELREMPRETVANKREWRKLNTKIRKVMGEIRERDLKYSWDAYRTWSEEEFRLDNLQTAAQMIYRSNASVHFNKHR